MMNDLEIAHSVRLEPTDKLRQKLGIEEDEFWPCGHFKGKVSLRVLDRLSDRPDGKLIVVTAITPTKYGEGKTTTSIGLSMGINQIGKSSVVTLREPSLGPVFGVKGGAAGGGYAQVLPMEDINLHFTGDIHAVTTANNLLSAMVDNHLHFSNRLGLDPRRILWRRAMDMNDRSLRNILVGLGGEQQGFPRQDGFLITAASEVMAILTLSRDREELKRRLGNILVGFTRTDEPIFARDFNVCGAMAAVLRDAIKPNLVQTAENTPALIHGGPFANISFGTNSVLATRLAMKLCDYTVTECGFGSDLGFEKFADLVSRHAGYPIHAVVLVATIRALRHQGGGTDTSSLKAGLANLGKHIENIQLFGIQPVVALNHFPDDRPEEEALVRDFCRDKGVDMAVSRTFAEGGAGARDLAEQVVAAADRSDGSFQRLYSLEESIEDKIDTIARRVYGASGVIFTWEAKKKLRLLEKMGLGTLPVCIAKTPMSLSDNKNKRNVPTGWRLNINDINLAHGAGYVIPISGDIMLMPGLPEKPQAELINIDPSGREITGLS